MSLSSRIARHTRQLRVHRTIRSQRRTTSRAVDPGSLLAFVPRLSKRFRTPDHLAELATAIERSAVNERVRACFSVPVRHGKTSLIHHAIAWVLAKDPTLRILYVSYAHGFAAKQVAKAKELAKRAGVAVVGRRRDEWTTQQGGLVKAVGIGGQITGEGFTHVFVDDPHKNRAEAESRIIREGVVEAFFNDIFTRIDPRGTSFFVVHARWTVNDLIGVLTRMEPHPFEQHNAPALDDEGNALAPWLFDAKTLEEIRDTVGPYTWASLYQGEPKPPGGALFTKLLLGRLVEPRNYRLAIGIDLARTVSQRADHNAAVVMRKNVDTDVIDILHAVRARGTIMDREVDRALVDEGFVRQVVPLLFEHPGAELVMYAAETEEALVTLFARELSDAAGHTVVVHALPADRDKWRRAQPYAASWNRSRVRIPGRSDVHDANEDTPDDGRDRDGWQSAFIAEHVDFTGVKGAEDDWVDAAGAAHDWLNAEQTTSLAEAMANTRGIR